MNGCLKRLLNAWIQWPYDVPAKNVIIFPSNSHLHVEFYYVFAFAFRMYLICTTARIPVSENTKSDTV